MARILVSDNSVLIEFSKRGLLDKVFRLPFEFVVRRVLDHRFDRQVLNVPQRHGPVARKPAVLRRHLPGAVLKLPWRVGHSTVENFCLPSVASRSSAAPALMLS